MHDPSQLDLTPLSRALASLDEGLAQPPRNKLERDGVIQRFEYTFELCWKSIQKALVVLGRTDVSGSPKPLFRDALREGWIADLSSWFSCLEARNETTHIYNEAVAERVYKVAAGFPLLAHALLVNLRQALAGS